MRSARAAHHRAVRLVTRPAVILGLAAATVLTAAATAHPAAVVITPTDDAAVLAAALVDGGNGPTIGATSLVRPPVGTPNAVTDTALAGMPTDGRQYLILTNGDASGTGSTNLGGSNIRGGTEHDVSILQMAVHVPAGANCLAFDFRFLTDEDGTFLQYNDAFIAELDHSDWSANTTITAPHNFAVDPSGDLMSVNSAPLTTADASGTGYGRATPLLRAHTPATPGDHTLYLSIFDQGDELEQSAAFLDNLFAGSGTAAQCNEPSLPTQPSSPADTRPSPAPVPPEITGCGPITQRPMC